MSTWGLVPQFDSIPTLLKRQPRWVLWRAVPLPDGRVTKKPYQPSGKTARVNDRATWSPYERCLEAYQADPETWSGVGFVLTGAPAEVTVLDLDKCVKDGVVKGWAKAIVDAADSYTELSPSGTGLRVITRGDAGAFINGEAGIECYTQESTRFLTITGHVLDGRAEIKRALSPGLLGELEVYRPAERPVEGNQDPVTDSPENIERILSELVRPGGPYEGYEAWLKLGMALHHQYGGGPDGLEMWHRVCEPLQGYDADELDSKWDSFGGGGRQLTLRSIFAEAKDHGIGIRETSAATFDEFPDLDGEEAEPKSGDQAKAEPISLDSISLDGDGCPVKAGPLKGRPAAYGTALAKKLRASASPDFNGVLSKLVPFLMTDHQGREHPSGERIEALTAEEVFQILVNCKPLMALAEGPTREVERSIWTRVLREWRKVHGEKRPRGRRIDTRGVLDAVPTDYLIQGRLQRGKVYVVTGDPKAGKTFYCMHTGRCIANGEPVFGRPTCPDGEAPKKVLYLAFESQPSIEARIRAWHSANLKIPHDNFTLVGDLLARLVDAGSFRQLLVDLGEPEFDVLFIDTLFKATAGLDLNAANEAAPMMAGIREVTSDFNCATVIVHHGRKGSDVYDVSGATYGSVVIQGDVDGVTYIAYDEEAQEHVATSTMGRDGRRSNEDRFTIQGITTRAFDNFGEPEESAYLVESRPGVKAVVEPKIEVVEMSTQVLDLKNRLIGAIRSCTTGCNFALDGFAAWQKVVNQWGRKWYRDDFITESDPKKERARAERARVKTAHAKEVLQAEHESGLVAESLEIEEDKQGKPTRVTLVRRDVGDERQSDAA